MTVAHSLPLDAKKLKTTTDKQMLNSFNVIYKYSIEDLNQDIWF